MWLARASMLALASVLPVESPPSYTSSHYFAKTSGLITLCQYQHQCLSEPAYLWVSGPKMKLPCIVCCGVCTWWELEGNRVYKTQREVNRWGLQQQISDPAPSNRLIQPLRDYHLGRANEYSLCGPFFLFLHITSNCYLFVNYLIFF